MTPFVASVPQSVTDTLIAHWSLGAAHGLPYTEPGTALSGATVNLIGCCGYFWHKWIEDKVDGHDVTCPGNSGRINYMREPYDVYAPQDLNKDNLVNLIDVGALVKQWLKSDCLTSDDCDGADIDLSGSVDITDLANMAQRWLSTTE